MWMLGNYSGEGNKEGGFDSYVWMAVDPALYKAPEDAKL